MTLYVVVLTLGHLVTTPNISNTAILTRRTLQQHCIQVLRAISGNDTIFGNEGDNTLIGAAGDDLLYGGSGRDRIYGGEGNNILYGNEGDNTLTASNGNNIAYGGSGDDIFIFGDGNNVIFGNEGINNISTVPAIIQFMAVPKPTISLLVGVIILSTLTKVITSFRLELVMILSI